ncbi:hypothetical protein TNCV_2737831 [Trichonephila clavipes]|nr:hypothetical protein TNCV_2737831 [Trichonephila clavipes]
MLTQEEKSKVVRKADQVKTGEGSPLQTDQDKEQELLKEEYNKIKILFESVQKEVEHLAKVALSNNRNYTVALGDGPRNFEPWSSDVDDTAGIPSPNYHTTPMGGRLSSRQI